MPSLRSLGLRALSLVRRRRVEDELDEELRFHLDRETAERVKEECRDERGVR